MENAEMQVLEEIDMELKELKKYLSQNLITGDQHEKVVSPLRELVESFQIKKRQGDTAKKLGKICICLCLLILFLQVSFISKIISALGRILLLQLLPWWDWTRIYYSDCILTNPFYVKRTLGSQDCEVCESYSDVTRLINIPTKEVWDEYITSDNPFIVLDAMREWPIMNTEAFWFDNITELYLDGQQEDVEPCEFKTNLLVPSNNLQMFLQTIHDPNVRSWFGHWENCDKVGAKALRPLYRRPYFLPSMVDISDSNWILMSSNYIPKYYHQLYFSSELLMVIQIRGWNKFRLTPREPCNYYCPQITNHLNEGQIAVFTNFMWEFEYKPGEGTDNLAIVVGGTWS